VFYYQQERENHGKNGCYFKEGFDGPSQMINNSVPVDFPPADYTSWLEKIKAELKGKPFAEFDYVWDGILISPFGIPSLTPSLVSARSGNSWKIGSYVAASGSQANPDLLIALNEGAESLFMDIEKKPDWASLLDKVHLEWIHLNLRFDHSKELSSFLRHLNDTGQKFHGSIQVRDFNRVDLLNKLKTQDGWRILNYELKDIDSRHPLAEIFHQLTQDIGLLSTKFDSRSLISQVVIHLTGQNDLTLNISMIRAIRLLWKQLMFSAGFENGYPDIYLIAHIPDHHIHDPFIRSSLIAASMIMGGIDELFIENQQDKHKGRYGRMIQHIFNQEANLDKVADPLSGSRVIEYLTRLIVQRVWNESIRLDQLKK